MYLSMFSFQILILYDYLDSHDAIISLEFIKMGVSRNLGQHLTYVQSHAVDHCRCDYCF